MDGIFSETPSSVGDFATCTLSVRTYPFSLDLLKSFPSVPLSFKPFVGQFCVLSHLYLQSS